MGLIKALNQVHGICKLVNGGERVWCSYVLCCSNLGDVDNPFTGAEFGVNLNGAGPAEFNGDLVFLGVDTDTNWNDPEHFDRSGGTMIMDDFLTTSINSLAGGGGEPQIYTDSNANTALTNALNTAYDGGNAVGGYFVIRIMADGAPPANSSWQILSGDAGGGATEAPRINWADGSALPFASSAAATDLDTLRSGGSVAVPVTGIPNADFEEGDPDGDGRPSGFAYGDWWGSGQVSTLETEGDNQYMQIDSINGSWGVALVVANGNSPISLEALGLEAGNTYTWSLDAKTDSSGSAGFKLEWQGAGGDTGDLGNLAELTSNWATYSFDNCHTRGHYWNYGRPCCYKWTSCKY